MSGEAARSWSVLELVRWTTDYLAGKGIREPRLNAELLLAGVLGLKRLDLYLQFDRPMRPAELDDFRSRLKRRARHEPLQYIAGHADFRDLRLRVDRRVLIPRPETEQLVGEVLARCAGREGLTALDLGTGSGAIALSLATEGPFRRVVATDLSADALALARANQAEVAPGSPVEFREGHLFDPVRSQRFDVVVSNPPYVGESERGSLDAEVRDWEPAGALFSGSDGLELIAELLRGAPDHLEPGGLLAVEIGAGQGPQAMALAAAVAGLADAEVRKDLSGRDRFVLARRR